MKWSLKSLPRAAIATRRLPAWSMSLLLHLGLLLMAGYVLRFAPRGTPSPEADRTVGVALVREVEGRSEYLTTEQAQQSSAASSAPLAAALPSPAETAVDLSGFLPAADEGLAAASTLELPRAGGAASGARGRDGLSDSVRTTVFGTSGSGSKFVYVFDRSGSMAGFGGRPLAAAKRELTASLQDLTETTQFQIIFYNEDPHVFQFRSQVPRLVWANPEGRETAAQFVQGIMANGSTRHLPALKMALALRPDVIFFLTDADEPQLTDEELRQIQRWNQATAINAIEFGFGPQHRRDNFLVRLARDNGGQHAYVDISGFNQP
jgi:hypothetical protein